MGLRPIKGRLAATSAAWDSDVDTLLHFMAKQEQPHCSAPSLTCLAFKQLVELCLEPFPLLLKLLQSCAPVREQSAIDAGGTKHAPADRFTD